MSLVRYFGNESAIEGRFSVNLQVGQPDLEHALLEGRSCEKLRAEDEVQITGAWRNNGTGKFHNYSELDIYNVDDLSAPVWVGVLVGNVEAGETLEGEYINPNESDAFDTRCTPSERGNYVLRFTVDPERANSETDESNNVAEVYVSVRKAKGREVQLLDLVRRDDSDGTRETRDEDGQRGNTRREEERPEREKKRCERAERRGREESREREEDRDRGGFSRQLSWTAPLSSAALS